MPTIDVDGKSSLGHLIQSLFNEYEMACQFIEASIECGHIRNENAINELVESAHFLYPNLNKKTLSAIAYARQIQHELKKEHLIAEETECIRSLYMEMYYESEPLRIISPVESFQTDDLNKRFKRSMATVLKHGNHFRVFIS